MSEIRRLPAPGSAARQQRRDGEAAGMRLHRDSPMRRKMASGRVVWLARYTRPDGTRGYWKPEWNGGRATFEQRRDAQRAIDEAHAYQARHGRGRPDTVGAYLETWTSRRPRPERTSAKYEQRISRVLDVKVEGRPLADWRLRDLRRRHAIALVDHLLVEQGRTLGGVVTILRSLSAMAEDAITDDLAEINPFKGIKLGRNECSRSFEQIKRASVKQCIQPS
jgi:hypothetical protein